MVVFMLRNLRTSVALLVVSERLQRTFMKRALSLFGGAEGAMRVQAILFICQMAVVLPPPMLSVAMKVSLLCWMLGPPAAAWPLHCIGREGLFWTFYILQALVTTGCLRSQVEC